MVTKIITHTRAGVPRSLPCLALIVLTALFSAAVPSVCPADTIYYYKDEKGVLHFTDTPRSNLYQPFLSLRGRTSSRADRASILRHVEHYSKLHRVDPHLVMAVIEVESGFNNNAVSRAGAQGLMQIMPGTQRDLGLIAPFDAANNIEAGIRYLKMLMDRFSDLSLALAAYNAGPGAVERYKGIPPFQETRGYVRKVMANYDRRRSARN